MEDVPQQPAGQTALVYEYKHWHVPVFAIAFVVAVVVGGFIFVVGFYSPNDVVNTFVPSAQ